MDDETLAPTLARRSDVLAAIALAAHRPVLLAERPADTPVGEFVATLSDEQREMLADVIDEELARREAEARAATGTETPTL